MDFGRNNREIGHNVEFLTGLLELWKHQECQQECGDHINRDRTLVSSDMLVSSSGNAGIFKQNVNSLEALGSLGEGLDAFVALQIKLPYFDDAFAACRGLNVGLCSFAFICAATGQDEFLAVQADEVPCCLFAQSDIGPGDDNGSACAVLSRLPWCDQKLRIQEPGQIIHGWLDEVKKSTWDL